MGQKELGMEFEAAEAFKRGEKVGGVDINEATARLQASSEEIATEIARSVDLFRSTAYMEEINEVVLSGGGALVKGFPELLGDVLGIGVRLAEPFKNVRTPGKLMPLVDDMGAIAAVAVGLAIRRIGDR